MSSNSFTKPSISVLLSNIILNMRPIEINKSPITKMSIPCPLGACLGCWFVVGILFVLMVCYAMRVPNDGEFVKLCFEMLKPSAKACFAEGFNVWYSRVCWNEQLNEQ